MCPACITTAVIITATTGSTGAAATFLRKKLTALRGTGSNGSQATDRVSCQTKKESHYGGERSNAA
ncbi:MAG: hypothetical protein WBR26_24855 [Candidatus Acidiferrum sp.]